MSVVLLLVALVPLMGNGVATLTTVQGARAATDRADRTEQLARQAAELTRLDAAVFGEMVWSGIGIVVTSIGASNEQVTDLTGQDPSVSLQQRRTELDRALVGAPATMRDLVDEARANGTSLRGVLEQYGRIGAEIRSDLDGILAELGRTSGDGSTGDALSDSVTALQRSVRTRSAAAEQFYGFFATIFDVRNPPREELANLIRLRGRYRDGIASLSVDPSPAIKEALDALAEDEKLADFQDAIDGLIADGLTNGVPDRSAQLSLEAVMSNVDDFDVAYRAASDSSIMNAVLLDAATGDVLSAAKDVREDAEQNIRWVYLLAGVLTAATLLSAYFAGRFIVRPLRALHDAALALRADESIELVPVGPRELRAASQAMRDAALHVDLVTRQAQALAAGAFDAPVLDEVAPGGLGVALHDAVGTLRGALARQEDFRRRLAYEASHDGLTQLPNRNASMDQLTRALARTERAGSALAVLFVDLDHFKDVNDHHGHQAGDLVLATVAERLGRAVREGDHVGRLGGDEFLVVAEPVRDLAEAVAVAERIIAEVSEPIDIGAVEVRVGASVGIALSDGSSLTADEVLRDADLAVYRAKDSGRGGVEICDEQLRQEMSEAADLSVAIRRAIERDEFVVHYQPIVDPRSGFLRGLEALVRWRRPGTDGLVNPDSFIGFAERSSLIVEIDRWVVDAVARQIADWVRSGVCVDWPVAVNVSRRHLAHDDVVEHVLAPLRRHGVSPRSIVVEVTESALLDDVDSASTKLQQLRDVGVQVSIDDFGTGYTSLAHLRSLPIDNVKIDRSFTTNALTNDREASIVKLIIDTGHLLGASITAEGVETEAEAALMTRLGSDGLQGFLYSRPQPADLLHLPTGPGWISGFVPTSGELHG